MAIKIADRVKETTTTTGTGAVTLAGAVTGFRAFAAAFANADQVYYCIADRGGANWEVGIGTFTAAGTTLSRDTVLASSNTGALVSFGTGDKDVLCTMPAAKIVKEDSTPTWTGGQTFQAPITETPVAANTGTAYTVTDRSMHDLTLTGNCTFTFPAHADGKEFTLRLKQDATGSRTVTWPASVRWPGGTAPTITATAAKTDVISFQSDGTYWLGFVGGQNYTRA